MSRTTTFLSEKHHILLLILIALFALGLRLYRLDNIPDGFFSDEAAAGYDAYSLLKTGHDAQARFLPFHTQRFDVSYMEAIYTYLTIPFISLFGLTVFAVRLPAAIIGALATLTAYLFAKKMFNKSIGLIGALLLAVSPWHLPLTRWGHEASLVPFFSTLGLFLLVKSFTDARWSPPAALILGLSLYTYPVMKFFTPAAIVVIFWFYRREIVKLLRSGGNNTALFLAAALIFLLLSLPPYILFLSAGGKRFNAISIFTTAHPLSRFFANILAHLSPNFLFINGDHNLRHGVPGFGKILIFLAPFMIYTFYVGIAKRDKNIVLLISLFLLGVIPASLTNDKIPHALRTITCVPFAEIIAAAGMFYLFRKIGNTLIKTTWVILPCLNGIFFLYSYFLIYPPISQDWFNYGWKETIEYTSNNSQKYDRIILSSGNHAYIYALFFAKIDPGRFHRTGKMDKYTVWDESQGENYAPDGRTMFILDFGKTRHFPLLLSLHLPPDGTVKNKTVGPGLSGKRPLSVKNCIYNHRKQIVFAIAE